MENHKLINRFLSKVNKTENCWIWEACKTRQGYGKILFNGTVVSAHRISYELFVGPITNSLCVLHSCDNPSCVNPDHLFLGTKKDNAEDCVKKNRRSSRVGTNNGRAKLNEQDVRDVRTLYSSGGHTHKTLAKKYNVTNTMIRYIVNGQSWSHIT